MEPTSAPRPPRDQGDAPAQPAQDELLALRERIRDLATAARLPPPGHSPENPYHENMEAPADRPPGEAWRAIIYRLAREVASNLDAWWDRSRRAGEGPVDVIDLFSGCGGMSAGFRAVNGLVPAFRLALAVDINGVANSTYAANLGLRPVQEDISALAASPSKLRDLASRSGRRQGNPLVLIGCAPCQGFSSHRNSTGEGDTRNSLFEDFARIALELRPDVVVAENVPELLTGRYWPYVESARRILEQGGYLTHVGIHNMAEYGVPQERFRAVIVAMRRPFARLQGFLRRGEFRTVREAIGGLPAIPAGEAYHADPMHYTAGHKESTLATIRAVPKDGGSRPPDAGPDCLRRARERRGRAIYEDIYGRLYWDRPSITITGYARNPASGRFVHPEQDRGLSVREGALLQGFPSDYWFEGGLDQRFQQVGNAVPPAFAAYLALYALGEMLAPAPPDEWAGPGVTQPVGASFSRMIPALKAGSGHVQPALPGI